MMVGSAHVVCREIIVFEVPKRIGTAVDEAENLDFDC
jgi:hypothetical protein